MRRQAAAGLVAALAIAALACAGFWRQSRASTVRVVTLAPSLTEIAYAIGCGSRLVADTSYDDYPRAARDLPHVADLVSVDLEKLASLNPTVVVALHDQERQAAPILARLGVPVTYLPNRDLDDLFEDIAQVGRACGLPDAAGRLSSSMRTKLVMLLQRAARQPGRPKVLFLLGLPGFTVGMHSFVGDLIRMAGGINVAGSIPQPYPNVSSEWLLTADPDLVIVAREVPFGPGVSSQEPWRSMLAVRTGRILRPPSDDILERNGPRILQGLSWLIQVIHQRY